MIAFDQGSGVGLVIIYYKTPTAAEEILDGLDGTIVGGLVVSAGNSGVLNYVKTMEGITLNAAARKGSGAKNSDGSSSGAGQGAWDFALTGSGDSMGIEGIAWGFGYGEAEAGSQANSASQNGDNTPITGFVNY